MIRDLLRHARAVCAAKRRAKTAEARRIACLERAAEDRGYRSGYRARELDFTKLIDPGAEDTVWLTPKPERDVLMVAPPQKLPLRLEDYRSLPQFVRPLVFRPRVIAECYDGVQYRQVLWERSR